MPASILEHFDTIEESYEFMLAYAGQGLPADSGDARGAKIRDVLTRAAAAIAALAREYVEFVREQKLEPEESYLSVVNVLEHDAQSSVAAIDLVLAQPSISSQLVDHLNASIHLRALLTSSFLIGEVIRSQIASRQNH
jgi:hypothetical protein